MIRGPCTEVLRCCACGAWQPLGAYPVNHSMRRKRDPRCRVCFSIRDRRRYLILRPAARARIWTPRAPRPLHYQSLIHEAIDIGREHVLWLNSSQRREEAMAAIGLDPHLARPRGIKTAVFAAAWLNLPIRGDQQRGEP